MTIDPEAIGQRDLVHSLVRGLRIVSAFDALHPSLSLDAVAARTGISRSACRRLLTTLAERGYVRWDGREYSLTPRLLDLGYTQQSQLSLAAIVAPHADALSSAIDRHVSVATLESHDVMFVHRVGGRRIMRLSLSVGSRLPAHVTAIGRALLAWLPNEDLEAYLQQATFAPVTARSIRSADELRADLLHVRARGWSLVAEELELGLSAMAVPVRDREGSIVAAVNVSTQAAVGPALDSEVSQFLPQLLQTAAAIGMDVHPAHLG